MKLTKENIYINLQGKSKEELTDLWEFLKESNQETYNSSIEGFLRDFYNTKSDNHGIEFHKNSWLGSLNDENKTEVTIEQLKEMLQPMGNKKFKKGDTIIITDFGSLSHPSFTLNKPYILTEDFVKGETDFSIYEDDKGSKGNGYFREAAKKLTIERYKEILQPMICTQEQAEAPKLVNYNFMSNEYKTETLQEKEQRLTKELEEVRKEIEDSKIKDGDWCKFWNHDKDKFIIVKFQGNKFACISTGDYFLNCEKITNPELIKLLEQELINKSN